MKRVKKLIAIFFAIALMLNLTGGVETIEVKAATNFAITSPTSGSLRAAGYIDINWSSAANQGTVKDYKVYVDGSLVTTTTNLSYEFYTTKVNYHTVFVVANFTDGDTASTANVRFGVTKKGLCVNNEMGKKLNPLSMNMGWYYSWGTNTLPYTTYNQIEFVPMVWGAGNETNIINQIVKNNPKYLLPYNEPDMQGNGGSNIPVNIAINNWSRFVAQSDKYYLGSPAPAFSPSWGNGTWFRTFMDSIDHNTIDFIPLHCYYGQYGGAAGANTFLKDVVDKSWEMYHKPIWITEFAVSGWGYSNVTARKSMEQFMKTVIAGLNSRNYVERYSWFSFNTDDNNNGASALWTNATGVLTDLGRIYVDDGNPTSDATSGGITNVEHSKKTTTNNNNNNATVKKPAKSKVKSVKNLKGKKVKITLKKVSRAKGYQIRYSDSKKYRGYWNKTTTKTTYTVKRLSKKTTYYFKARAYVKNGKSKLYGSWSASKKVKIKK